MDWGFSSLRLTFEYKHDVEAMLTLEEYIVMSHSTTVFYWISFTVCTHMRDFEIKRPSLFVCLEILNLQTKVSLRYVSSLYLK